VLLSACSWSLLAVSAPSQAEPSSASLTVQRDEASLACPDGPQIVEALTHLAGELSVRVSNERHSDADHGLHVFVDIEKSREGYHARVSVEGDVHREREIDDANESCAGLRAAIPVAAAMMLDNLRQTGVRGSPLTQPEAAAPRRARTVQPRFIGSVAGAAAGGIVASTAVGGEFGAAFQIHESFWGSVGVMALPGQRMQFDEGAVRLQWTALFLDSCGRLTSVGTDGVVLGCGGVLAGRLRAIAEGYDNNDAATRSWVGASVGLRAAKPVVGPWGWIVALRLATPLRRESFSIEGASEAFVTPHVGWIASAGLQASIR
jgi:hypothetical protein